MNLSMKSVKKLNNGVEIPVLGFGTSGMKNVGEDAVKWALEEGYRLIDTASAYGNEENVGQNIKESGVPREDIFVTTKLWNNEHGKDEALKAFDNSCERLGVDYLDLYLIHWPASDKINETWRTLEKLLSEGKVKSIGVSNFTIEHFNKFLRDTEIVPAVNEIEFHPFVYDSEIVEYCKGKDIHIIGYSPIVRAKKMDNPVVSEIASEHNKSGAQVLLRWGLQHGAVVIPKSSNRERIKENKDVFDFELSDEEMNRMNELYENFRIAPDPRDPDFTKEL